MAYHCCPHSYDDVFAAANEARQWARRLYQENAELRRQLEVATQAIYNAIDDSVNYRLDVIISDLRLELAKIKRDTPHPTEDVSR